MDTIIKVENVTKKYKLFRRKQGIKNKIKSVIVREYEEVLAVNDISFSLKKKKILGLIGPNGSGKTTIIKLLTGIMASNEGHIEVLGKNPFEYRKYNAAFIGVLFAQRNNLNWELSVEEGLKYLYTLYTCKSDYKKRLYEIIEIVNIEEYLNIPLRKLSLGQRTICEIIGCVMHKPQILFLDEPTLGLDFEAKENVYRLLKYVNEIEGTTIVITSHDLHDIERLADEIFLINKGHKVYGGSIKEFMAENGKLGDRITIVPQNGDGKKYLKQILNEFSTISYNIEKSIIIDTEEHQVTMKIINKLMENSDIIAEINVSKPTIEEVIRKVYSEEKNA